MNVIGIVGFLGSGKGTVGDILANQYGFQKLAFADPLKDATAAIFGWPRHLLEGDTTESREFRETEDLYWTVRMKKSITPRKVLQLVGTECMRDVFGSDIWIAALERKIFQNPERPFVITDCRFPNEIKTIQLIGGKVVRVVRGPEPEWFEVAHRTNFPLCDSEVHMMDVKFPNVHVSEWAWIGQKFDYVVDNNSNLDDLNKEVTKMLLSIEEENKPYYETK